jgi:beta-1,2-mannobiose phosphorylase / 1,2-beta-oligomannan phosphorylase
MLWADSTRLGRPFSKDPSVIKFDGRYRMYFSLPPFAQELAASNSVSGWSIGIAESSNLVDWKKVGELTPEQPCESKGLCAPGARVLNGRVHLFYQTYGNGSNDAICHAVSDDGLHFKRDPSNPVFHPAGPWTAGRAIDAEVIPFRDQLLLFFATRDSVMKTQMVGVAAAPLASDFSRGTWKQQGNGPILKPELPWERKCIEAPAVLQRGDTLYMFYAGGYNCEPQQIGIATSTNGVSWHRLFDEPLIPNGGPGDWNSSESGHPGIFEDTDGRSFLFFQGNNDNGRTWFLSCVEISWQNGRPVAAGLICVGEAGGREIRARASVSPHH